MMSTSLPLPGSPRHQSLLQTIADLYARDGRILAILVYGSLGRAAWDIYSDLDLAVVIQDDVQIEMVGELDRVKTALAEQGERTLFTEVAGDEGYLLLQSLNGIALCYHPLQAMNPYLLAGWRMVLGSLDAETIRAAAKANDRPQPTLNQQVHRVLWLALGVDIALQRRQFWCALPGLEQMRGGLLEIFAASHGGKRAYQHFDEAASADLKTKFGRALPQHFPDSSVNSIHSLGDALLALLHLVEHDLAELSNGQVHLGPGEREVLSRLRSRQAALRNGSG